MQVGTRLGAYEVLAKIGEGGMGEVYLARDTRLERDVAIKVLPEKYALDPERLARFTREAQVLASLNHPNIAAIYGFEEVGALVLEYVDGPTLADRIARGALPLDEAVPIARQIADALEAAHEQQIIHRDLKPANVKLRADGTVKVLDFGLAKLLPGPAEAGHHDTPTHLTVSPTITTPAMTMAGVILGTAAYMSPEQAKGRAADKRSDLWAFGCVLYEMLTGKRPFDGADVSDTLAAVLRAEPDWNALPANTPRPTRTLLRRCLEKDRKRRLADVSDARLELDEAGVEPAAGLGSPAPAKTSFTRRAVTVAIGMLSAITITSAAWWIARPQPDSPIVTRFSIPLADDDLVASYPFYTTSTAGGRNQVFAQPFPPTGTKYLVGTGIRPLWSRSGKEIFYFRGDGGTLFETVIATRPGLILSNETALPFNVLLGRGTGGFGRDADIMPDDKRFVAVVVSSGSLGSVIRRVEVVANWFEELKQRVNVN